MLTSGPFSKVEFHPKVNRPLSIIANIEHKDQPQNRVAHGARVGRVEQQTWEWFSSHN